MKEKRILCIEVSGECKNLANINSTLLADIFKCEQGLYCIKNPVAWKPITKDACNNCKHAEYKGITREQAIERIAKSLFKVDNVLALDIKWSKLKKSKQLVYKEFAEAALNSLLEDK